MAAADQGVKTAMILFPRILGSGALVVSLILRTSHAGEPTAVETVVREIRTAPRPEDLVYDPTSSPEAPRFYVSCLAKGVGDGSLWRIDADTKGNMQARALFRAGEPEGMSFRPTGLDVTVEPDGVHLYVINRKAITPLPARVRMRGPPSRPGRPAQLRRAPPDENCVWEYRVEEHALQWLRCYCSTQLVSPNDVVVDTNATPVALYVSNDNGIGFRGLMRTLFRTKSGSVVKLTGDGAPARTVATDLQFANGVAIRDGHLYVGELVGGRISRAPLDGTAPPQVVATNLGGVDNMYVDDAGSLWVASHQHPVALGFRILGLPVPSESMAICLDITTNPASRISIPAPAGYHAMSTARQVGNALWCSQLVGDRVLCVSPIPGTNAPVRTTQ